MEVLWDSTEFPKLPRIEERLQQAFGRPDKLWSGDTYSKFALDPFERGYVPDAGILNSGITTIELDLGPSVRFSVKNVNLLPISVSVKASVGPGMVVGQQSQLLAPQGYHTFGFAVFGQPPLSWRFDVTAAGLFYSDGRLPASLLYTVRSY